uniref:SERPIN domain-containing protein n=1 Tax=Heterorhabditis bacteriophora TaxID=37862 RepID=A0A1I7XHE1_HETBA
MSLFVIFKNTSFHIYQYNEALISYGLFVIKNSEHPILDTSLMTEFDKVINYSSNSPSILRYTAPSANICVSPLQAARGWALLSLAANGKTKKTTEKLVNNS